jgi:density-regulated protein DRP1
MSTRNKKKSNTSVSGLDLFGVKHPEASKLFGKKFATGASISKTAEGKEQIDMQGDFVGPLAELILKTWGASHGIEKPAIYVVTGKTKTPFFGGGGDGGGEEAQP